MLKQMFRFICSTDFLPVVGGASGGVAAAELLPSVQAVTTYVIMAAIGAVVGYLMKLLLDIIFKPKKRKDGK